MNYKSESIVAMFRYSPLVDGRFRLLRIAKVIPKLEFELSDIDYKSPSSYIALSYAWGISPANMHCLCNGSDFIISQTLWDALQNIHEIIPHSYLWIDAICINQRDEIEKASQVSQMSTVYSNADKVIVWLGESEYGSAEAIERIPHLKAQMRITRAQGMGIEGENQMSQLPSPRDAVWLKIFRLYARWWFRRMWIAQEVILSADFEFLCGRDRLHWVEISDFAKEFVFSGLRTEIAAYMSIDAGEEVIKRCSQGMKLAVDIRLLRYLFRNKPDNERWISRILHIMQSQAVSEKVDSIYGIRAMLPDPIQNQVSVDYSSQSRKSYWRLHAKSFALFLQEINDLPSWLFLQHVKDISLPSWCPMWGRGWNAYSLPDTGTGAGRLPVPSAFPKPGEWVIRLSSDCRTLTLAGTNFDIIKSTLPLPCDTEDVSQDVSTLRQMSSNITNSIHIVSDLPESQIRLANTLCGDHNWWRDTFLSPDNEDLKLLEEVQRYIESAILRVSRLGSDDASAPMSEVIHSKRTDALDTYCGKMVQVWKGRALARTEKNRIGLVPAESRTGDLICVFFGAKSPFVLSAPGEDDYILRGPAYVDDVMDGELFDLDSVKKARAERQLFRLV